MPIQATYIPGEPLLTARNLRLAHNNLVLLDDASLSIHAGERIGLIGRNGCGKSTFLQILVGELTADQGTIVPRQDLVLGYLPQEARLEPELNVLENIRQGARHILDAIAQFEALPGDSSQHEILETFIQRHDGWNLDHRIRAIHNRLACPDPSRDVELLSGGERRRVALARALVAQPDLLILDEPTNHLDTQSIEWLLQFLSQYPGALLLVTHDRHFLDEITTNMVELRNGAFEKYTGNYSAFLEQRAEKVASEESNEHKRQQFLKRELEWARRRPKAQTSKSKARLDRLADVVSQGPPSTEGQMDLVLPPPPQLGNRVVKLESVAYRIGDRTLFQNLSLSFAAGMRLGVVGRNGVGKTTLVRVLLGELPPAQGTVSIGQLTEFNYVDQGRLQLREDRTVLEEMGDGSDWVTWGNDRLSIRAYLKRFLFTDDRLTTQVRLLSGGERSRLLLARILKRGGNFLILDEPTNDLDLATLRVLEEALIAFPGCVLVVSHDRYFLNRVCTGILAFEEDATVRLHLGNYDTYLASRSEAVSRQTSTSTPTAAAGKADPSEKPRISSPDQPKKLTYKEKMEFASMESTILEAESEVARLEGLFASPDFHRLHAQDTPSLTRELEDARTRVAELYARWEALGSRPGATD